MGPHIVFANEYLKIRKTKRPSLDFIQIYTAAGHSDPLSLGSIDRVIKWMWYVTRACILISIYYLFSFELKKSKP